MLLADLQQSNPKIGAGLDRRVARESIVRGGAIVYRNDLIRAPLIRPPLLPIGAPFDPMSDNLFELLQSRFPEDRSRPVMETGDGGLISYDDLERATGRIATLLHRLGVRKGDRVAAQVKKSPEAIMLYLGCLRAGAAYLPLNTAYRSEEIGYFLGDAEPRVVVCDPEAEGDFTTLARAAGVAHVLSLGQNGDGSLLTESRNESPDFACIPAAADDLAAILYTSGTTGRSKGAMLSHRNLASNALALHRIWGFREDDVLLHALPIYHTHGLFVATNCALLNGTG